MVDGSLKQGDQRLLAWCGRQRVVDGDADHDADRDSGYEKSMINAAGAMTRDPRSYMAPNFRCCSWVGNPARR
jgi:hypothetical protein